MAKTDQRRVAVRDTIKKMFDDAVDTVQIEEGLDSDGQRVWRISVVLKKNAKLQDRRKMLSVVRNLRTQIDDDSIFPLVDFLSASDAAKRKRAVA